MNKTQLIGALVGFFILSQASAATISPSANFTLRSTTNAGPPTYMDNSWYNDGMQGLLTNLEGSQVDRTFFEYGLSSLTGTVTSATLKFELSGTHVSQISMGSYIADGVSSFDDWFAMQTPVTAFSAGQGVYAIDITSALNSTLGNSPFIGFGFSIFTPNSPGTQAMFSWDAAPIIDVTVNAIPEPNLLALMALAIISAVAATSVSRSNIRGVPIRSRNI